MCEAAGGSGVLVGGTTVGLSVGLGVRVGVDVLVAVGVLVGITVGVSVGVFVGREVSVGSTFTRPGVTGTVGVSMSIGVFVALGSFGVGDGGSGVAVGACTIACGVGVARGPPLRA